MVKHLKLVGHYFRINLSQALEYRASFWTKIFGMAINNASFIFFWWIAFDQAGGLIAGYDFRDVMFIWAATSTAFGVSHVVFGNLNQITRLIVQGELDTYLLQPKNTLLSLLCARTDIAAWGDVLYGVILMAATHLTDGMAWAMFGLAVLIGTVLITAVAVTAHSSTFYLGDGSMIGTMALEFVINFSTYPMGIYKGFIRVLLHSLFPAALIVHIPLQLARSFEPWLLLTILGGAVIYCVLAYWFFMFSLKRYESGNLIQTRL